MDSRENAGAVAVPNGVVGDGCDADAETDTCASRRANTVAKSSSVARINGRDRDLSVIEEEGPADFESGYGVGSRFCKREKSWRVCQVWGGLTRVEVPVSVAVAIAVTVVVVVAEAAVVVVAVMVAVVVAIAVAVAVAVTVAVAIVIAVAVAMVLAEPDKFIVTAASEKPKK